MDGERKKRKKDDQVQENENEDENVEKFFALIRSTREVKERLLSMASCASNTTDHPSRELQHDNGGKSRNLLEAVENVPTFASEDFMKMEDRHHPPPDLNIGLRIQSCAYDEAAAAAAGTSGNSKTAAGGDDNGGGDDHDLDLKLSL